MYAIKVFDTKPNKEVSCFYVAPEIEIDQPALTKKLAEAYLWNNHNDCELWLLLHRTHTILLTGEIIRVL